RRHVPAGGDPRDDGARHRPVRHRPDRARDPPGDARRGRAEPHVGGRGAGRWGGDARPRPDVHRTPERGRGRALSGKVASSLAHAESASALYDPARNAELTRMLGTEHGISALAYVAWNLWFLGRPDAARARWGDTVALARRAGHPFSLANALFLETVLQWYRRGLATVSAAAAGQSAPWAADALSPLAPVCPAVRVVG